MEDEGRVDGSLELSRCLRENDDPLKTGSAEPCRG